MAFSLSYQNTLHPHLNLNRSSCSSFSSSSSSFLFHHHPTINFKPCSSSHNQSQTHSQSQTKQPEKKKRKPRPSFYHQIQHKWSQKPPSSTTNFPWQQQQQIQEQEQEEEVVNVSSNLYSTQIEEPILGFDQSPKLYHHVVNTTKIEEPINNFESENLSNPNVESPKLCDQSVNKTKIEEPICSFDHPSSNYQVSSDLGNCLISENKSGFSLSHSVDGVEVKRDETYANRLPWMPGEKEEERGKRSKTELAEKSVPEHELKRLRNVALRMKERIKVGAAGVTQALVDVIREKWRIDEVVKLKFEGLSSLNMKRMHEVLESKTGGLVIWRSGSSVVLYRGLTYGLGCVQTYVREKGVNVDIQKNSEEAPHDSATLPKDLSEEELIEISELNDMLNDLGPRYKDWSGRPPQPVDADLLPGFVPGYKTPLRRLPYGVRRALNDVETTRFRRLARNMPPHFALGRNRELQGLAAAMVKLWQKSAIAKIAIKRGVLNTNNERMAEQLKRLTGGTLLSRNKEYIVFYRGNDFLTPPVTEALQEREKLTTLQYQEEEARLNACGLINSNAKSYKTPMVAGTLAETIAATSRWGKQQSSEDVEKMLKDAAVARHASLVKYLEKKFAMAKGKLMKAEKALAKVQESLEPSELPTDLETITDEERLVFRKMGLSMKPFLLLGRREVFDGTIENMHMHWKFRELVKLIVKENNLAQVKHIAISLEAESGGILVSIDKTTKGYAIILYRGKNYQRPLHMKPRNLLTRRQALARSIELQRREGLKHHISSLQEQIELLKSGLEDMKDGEEIDDKTFYEILDDSTIPSDDDTDTEEDEDEEAYLQTYVSGDENEVV